MERKRLRCLEPAVEWIVVQVCLVALRATCLVVDTPVLFFDLLKEADIGHLLQIFLVSIRLRVVFFVLIGLTAASAAFIR